MSEWLREWQIYYAEQAGLWPLHTIANVDFTEDEDELDEELTDKEKDEMVEEMNVDFYDGALGREGDSYFPDGPGCPILNSYTLGIVFESPNYSAEKRQEPWCNWLFEDVVTIRGYYNV